MKCPRLVISGTSSNSGKTFVTMGLARALERRGIRVACFKSGPDYIDASYLSAASKRPSGNLDTWLMSSEHIRRAVGDAARDSDIIIIEGVRSLYDGASPLGDEGSTAHLAKVLDSPVILVMNIMSLARGAAASALGFIEYDRDVNVSGFILNMVKGPRHHIKATSAIWQRTGRRIYGSIRRDPSLSVTMRHLGLITPAENDECERAIERAADVVEDAVDVDALYELACTAPELDAPVDDADVIEDDGIKLAIASDKAFTFIYHENLSALRSLGAKIEYVSPISDSRLPEDTSALMLLGGYPECHATELSQNPDFIRSVKKAIDDGMPTYAECGGMMYLGKGITDIEGHNWKMAGVLDIESRMHRSNQSVSYTELEAVRESIVANKGSLIRGHEFHYSSIDAPADARYAFKVRRGKGIDGMHDGLVESNVLAQYTHIHMASQTEVARAICNSAGKYRRT